MTMKATLITLKCMSCKLSTIQDHLKGATHKKALATHAQMRSERQDFQALLTENARGGNDSEGIKTCMNSILLDT